MKAKYDLTSPWKLAEPYSVDQLRQALRDLTLAQSDVELYGSRVSAAALAACAGEAVLITKDFEMYDGNYRAENPKRDWFKDRNLFERMDEFAGNRSAYLIAAKEDIGTLDY